MKKQISLNLAWSLVILGGIIECFWVSGLKYANTLPLYILTGVGICISFACAVIAMKKIEVSIAYSVFVGIGTAGVVLVEMFYFKENFSLFKIILILTLLSGVIGLKFISKENKD
ncbi:DMT family transporter [Campylobacter sp. TTU_617]|uniref:DMT family transporter n=1 Tax=Campylobacter sp. TTU_617 TaxID=2768148 RepID=UPI0019050644|nr:multidrug efflux SMR transporter [Campylobacter sp. TTU_617]MBK1971577.1 multidrug efflux SMR transporter [Campylobacter sp. TTU_617]